MEDETTDHMEHAEHAQHAAHVSNPTIIKVSATVALLAVLAAIVGSLESEESSATISDRTAATLIQNQATDQWGFYQSKSLKKNMYEIAAANGGPNAASFTADMKKNEADAAAVKDKASALDSEVEDKVRSSERHEQRLHQLTFATTMLHVSIAVATLSIIMHGNRWPWYGSMALGAFGVLSAIYTFV